VGKNFAVLDIFFMGYCLGGIMHLKPTAGCQILTFIFEKKIVEGGPYKYPMKNISRTAKFLPTLGLN
jgi:hypothetical protein